MAVLFIAEIEQGRLSLASEACLKKITVFQETLTEQEAILDLLIIHQDWQTLLFPKDLLQKFGKLWVAETLVSSALLPEEVAPLIASIAPNYSLVIAPHTHKFSPIMLRVAASLDQNPVLDVAHVLDENRFEYQLYNGLFLKTILTQAPMQILTLNGAGYQSADNSERMALGQHNFNIVQPVTIPAQAPLVHCKAGEPRANNHKKNSLQTAHIVIGCGGGVEDEAQFKKILQLADYLQAAVGGSKVFIDQGFLSSQELIGQSGKEIAPTLYLALGISGSMHHLSAVKDSKIIIAVNKDAEAAIIALSDYSLIGDIEHIIPELIKAFA